MLLSEEGASFRAGLAREVAAQLTSSEGGGISAVLEERLKAFRDDIRKVCVRACVCMRTCVCVSLCVVMCMGVSG